MQTKIGGPATPRMLGIAAPILGYAVISAFMMVMAMKAATIGTAVPGIIDAREGFPFLGSYTFVFITKKVLNGSRHFLHWGFIDAIFFCFGR